MEEKKQMKVRLSTVILLVIIFMLIIAIMGMYIYFTANKETIPTSNSKIEQNEINNNVNLIEKDTLKELTLDNKVAKELYSNIEGMGDSFYKYQNVNRDNISNELILRMAYSKAYDFEAGNIMKTDSTYNYLNDSYLIGRCEYLDQYIEKTTIDKYIKEIFGDIKYSEGDFKCYEEYIADVTEYDASMFHWNASKNRYEFLKYQGGGGAYADCSQYFVKAIEYDDKVEVYTKIYFIELNNDDRLYTAIYTDFDFENEKLKNEIYKEYGTDDFPKIPIEDKFISKVTTTYKYTFEKDSKTGNYYFSSFEKVD